MSVKLRITLALHPGEGLQTVDVDGGNVGEALTDFVRKFPRFKDFIFDCKGGLLPYIEVFVNGESIYPAGLDRPMYEGDEVYIVNVMSGG